MISELDRYHGVVLRQMLVAHGRPASIGVVDVFGRVDAFSIAGAAFHIKHSAKRLTPWRFTYMPENLEELAELRRTFDSVWVFLVCGEDGVVGLSFDELHSILAPGEGGAAWIRVSRSRNSMYRVGGVRGDLSRAKPRGVQPFLESVFKHDLGLGAE